MTDIYKFGNNYASMESNKNLLGGKGVALQKMSMFGYPVPPGFTFPTTLTGTQSFASYKFWINSGLKEGLAHIKGDYDYMPLVSVRSGAPVSMPGMMETILNVGLSEASIKKTWKKKLGRKVAYDSYCRLIRMMGETCAEINPEHFDIELEIVLNKYHVKSYYDLHATGFVALSNRYKNMWTKYGGMSFPDNGVVQLKMSINAVYNSWDAPKAVEYRKIHDIPNHMGTAVTIQAMVFGNMNDNSMTGVVFSRNPNDGKFKMTGEYLVNAQGEDVVNGSVTPKNINLMVEEHSEIYEKLYNILNQLEKDYKDMQDVEFTVQDGELFILQTRSGKRTAQAAFKIADDMISEGMITEEEALKRVTSTQYFEMKKPVIDPSFTDEPDAVGLAAGGGLVSGKVVMSSQEAINADFPCILVTEQTTPDDIAGMNASVGILTRKGGMTSHAAVVARGMNKSCVVACSDLPELIGGKMVTIDGITGNVWIDKAVPVIVAGHNDSVKRIEQILVKKHDIKVSVTPDDVIENDSIIRVRGGGFEKVRKALGSNEIKRVTLELESDSNILYCEEDKGILGMFGDQGNILEDGIAKALHEIASKVDGIGHKIIINVDTQKQGSIIGSLKLKGVNFPLSVEKVEDLMTDDVLRISDDFVKEKIGSSESFSNLIKDLRLAGRKVEMLSETMNIEDVIINYLS